ncbi:MAG: sodium:solute symporter family protein, partial [Synergistaceae bacterium]|nr:sodium:solute symporter family protein [Synergistaceae bacterium]
TMLNHIAYIGTGGLISMLVGPTIMRTIVDANLMTCFLSMLTGFFANVYLVIYGGMGWVESPIVAGIAGSIVYLVVGYVTNGMKRIPEGREVATD